MGYYSGVIEHDTGVHADAEQQVAGQKMLMIEITDLITKNAKADYLLKMKKAEFKECKQKLYEALKALDEDVPITNAQKEELRKLCSDREVAKK